MRRAPEYEALRWLQQSEEDLDAAKYNFEGGKYYLVCFLAQQIAEKALKALIYFQGEEIVIGHSVAMLAERVRNYGIAIDELADEISVLDGYYIPTRYPNGLPDGIPARVYNGNSAENALRLAEKTVEFASKIIVAKSS